MAEKATQSGFGFTSLSLSLIQPRPLGGEIVGSMEGRGEEQSPLQGSTALSYSSLEDHTAILRDFMKMDRTIAVRVVRVFVRILEVAHNTSDGGCCRMASLRHTLLVSKVCVGVCSSYLLTTHKCCTGCAGDL